jgi:hypothetical protein
MGTVECQLYGSSFAAAKCSYTRAFCTKSTSRSFIQPYTNLRGCLEFTHQAASIPTAKKIPSSLTRYPQQSIIGNPGKPATCFISFEKLLSLTAAGSS